MCYISAKLFLILCEYVLICTCTQRLIKKLIFLVCVPSIAQLSTVMHCICIVHLAYYVLFVLVINIFKKTKKNFVFCISHLGFIIKDWPFYFYITSLCTLFSLDELIYCTSLVETLKCMLCGKDVYGVYHFVLILKSHIV